MKKIALIITAFLFASIAFAQKTETAQQKNIDVEDVPIQKGNWMVGGSLSSANYHFEWKSFHLSVYPQAGYFISDDVVIGVNTHVALNASKNTDNVWNYGVGPFARYYLPGGKNTAGRFFGEGRLGVGSSSVSKDFGMAYSAGAGYTHLVTKSVALQVFTGYHYSKSTYKGATASSQIEFNLGFQIYLPGKR